MYTVISEISTGMQGWLKLHKSINILYNINKMKAKNSIISSFNRHRKKNHLIKSNIVQDKNPQKLGIEGRYLNSVETKYDKSIAYVTLNGERLKTTLQKSAARP
jgi:hypothetical protein